MKRKPDLDDVSDVHVQHKDSSFKMRSAGLILAISLCVAGIVAIVARAPDKADSLAVFALACTAMVLSVAYVTTKLSDMRSRELAEINRASDRRIAQLSEVAKALAQASERTRPESQPPVPREPHPCGGARHLEPDRSGIAHETAHHTSANAYMKQEDRPSRAATYPTHLPEPH